MPLEEEDAHPAEPVPSPAATDVDAAIAAAELVVDLFARPSMEQKSWLNELMPHLSQTGAPLFATIKPSSITSTVRLGPGELMADASEYVVLVKVPTDAGVLAVSLSRSSTDSAWRVDRIRPVEG